MRRIKPFPPVLKPFAKPDVTPYCGVLLIILSIFLGAPPDFYSSYFGYSFDAGKVPHADLIPLRPPYIPMRINKNGIFLFNECVIDDFEKLPLLIEEYSEEQKIYSNIIQFFIDKDVQFGRILEVFRFLKKAGYDRIVLSSGGSVSTLDIMRIEKTKSLLRSAKD